MHDRVLPETDDRMRTCVGIELILFTCYILIIRAYECVLPCMYNDDCNAEHGLQLWNTVDTYLLN